MFPPTNFTSNNPTIPISSPPSTAAPIFFQIFTAFSKNIVIKYFRRKLRPPTIMIDCNGFDRTIDDYYNIYIHVYIYTYINMHTYKQTNK